jgi:hypothetical protein
MSERNGAAPGGVPFEWEGQTYVLGRMDFQVELAAQKRIEATEYRRLLAHKDLLGPEEYERRLDRWSEHLGTNRYAVGSAAFYQWLASKEGLKEFTLLLMDAGQREGGERPSAALVDAVSRDGERWRELGDLVVRTYFPFLLSQGEFSPPSAESRGSGPEPRSSPAIAGGLPSSSTPATGKAG